jgi:trk system potassium uptake protein TrkH
MYLFGKLARSPARMMVLGFAVILLVGAALLQLPAAAADGHSIGFLNAMFTSTSGICVIGLSVFELGAALSPFGQIVVLVLMQLGGIGIMTMTSIVYLFMGKRFSLRGRMLMSYDMAQLPLQRVVRMARSVAVLTGAAEGAGIALFAVRFVPMFGLKWGMYYSVFQSVSAFCNVGFDIFGHGSTLIPFAGDVWVNVATMILAVAGGFGFFVVSELHQKILGKTKAKMTLHTKMVLWMTALLISGGFIIFLIAEYNNPLTLGAPGMAPHQKVVGALSQSVYTRSAGFYIFRQADMTPLSKVVTGGLMFIGAAPTGTGGGIKVTTTALTALFFLSVLRGRRDVELGMKRIDYQLVLRAVTTFVLGAAFVVLISAAIYVIERERIPLTDVTFEVVGAFGTAGLSTGATPLLSVPSLILLMITMFGGRVGVFSFTMALAYTLDKRRAEIRYPEDKVMIG